MALRFSHYVGTTAQLCQNLQAQFDLEVASRKIGKQVKRGIKPLHQASSGSVRAVS
jgi:plasmid maintenance system antidote protein VapI